MFLFISNKQLELDIFLRLFTIVSKNVLYIVTVLRKMYKVFILKAIKRFREKDLSRWKATPCSWIRKFNVFRMPFLSQIDLIIFLLP